MLGTRVVHLAIILSMLLILFPNVPVPVTATSNNLHGLVMVSGGIGWAVGDAGTILRYDGSAWNQIPSGVSTNLYSVSFGPPKALTADSGVAVGGMTGSPMAVFWTGVAWMQQTSGLTSSSGRLASVFETSSNDVWAVDDAGGFWHWSGTPGLGGGWSLVSTAISGLNSVFMIGTDDGWAVGIGGLIYHYSGGGWTLFAVVGVTLNSVFMLSSSEGWAVGNGGVIYHYTSGTWAGPISPAATSTDLRSIFMVGQSDGWAVGAAGTVLHYSGGFWTKIPMSSTTQNVNSVSFAQGVGWAAGDLGVMFPVGPIPQGIPATTLQSVYLLGATDGWMVGCSTGGCGSGVGEPVVGHWNGVSTTRAVVAATVADLYSVFMLTQSEGWAVGGITSTPLILHYTGGFWNQVPAPSSGYVLRSVYMIDSGNGWAVGDGGVILHYSGGAWDAVSSPTISTLRSVFMLGGSDGWIVGDAGTILRYQGSSGLWMVIASPTGTRLNSVSFIDQSNGWAVGEGGTILHYGGAVWTGVAGFASTNLNSVFQVSQQEAWAVGDSGTILHWTGIAWYSYNLIPPITGNPDLESIFLLPSGYGVFVGKPASPGGQATVYPIPEFSEVQMLMIIALVCVSLIIARLQRRYRE